jgi:hypothetical protein
MAKCSPETVFEITAKAAVADECLVAPGEFGAQCVEDGTALLGVAPGLGEIAANDVASIADLELLGLELGGNAGSARHDQWDEARLIVNDGAAYLRSAALAHAEDVFELAFLQGSNGLGADHVAVGDNTDVADAKPRAQPVDDRQEVGHVGGTAGPQLGAQRPSVLIHDQSDDHLMEIRAVVFRIAAAAELLELDPENEALTWRAAARKAPIQKPPPDLGSQIFLTIVPWSAFPNADDSPPQPIDHNKRESPIAKRPAPSLAVSCEIDYFTRRVSPGATMVSRLFTDDIVISRECTLTTEKERKLTEIVDGRLKGAANGFGAGESKKSCLPGREKVPFH